MVGEIKASVNPEPVLLNFLVVLWVDRPLTSWRDVFHLCVIDSLLLMIPLPCYNQRVLWFEILMSFWRGTEAMERARARPPQRGERRRV